jgi:conjugative transposon TraN protein
MKNTILLSRFLSILLTTIAISSNAQKLNEAGSITGKDLPVYEIPLCSTVHIISPESINYVDISTPDVQGDLTDKKIFRLKTTSALKDGDTFTVSIVSGSFLVVYRLKCISAPQARETYVINISPSEVLPLNNAHLSESDFYKLGIHALTKKRSVFNTSTKDYGLKFWVNNIFVVDDFIIFDLGLKNQTNLQLDLENVRFKLRDKKIAKATVSQEVILDPVFRFYPDEDKIIRKRWRNFYVFKKFTFPDNKRLSIELTEKQISGRKITLDIKYNQVLAAETLQ